MKYQMIKMNLKSQKSIINQYQKKKIMKKIKKN